ncbi:hypothetical protein F5Y00DRAFT_58297 [Daldinia vernicosa]|uniref:uncharacterized protein n=1 Tax=Daldinia vernicosa TaxID=114800 RepID=UPI002007ED09|nr:uncharacterized protein F5Y00DRAFT_58297 [Daldinia vernicosa]KAI0853699.1 hypothetical protein F5Y00DRAFT_58297 [Daldinia vernicosa]
MQLITDFSLHLRIVASGDQRLLTMARNPSRTSSGRGASIDLNTINDDDEDHVATNLSRPYSSPQERRKRRCSPPNSRSRINASNAPTSTHIESNAVNHPSKRQKLSNGTGHKAATPIPDTEALTRCLQTQVFPHLDAAVKELDKNVFDVEKLGGKVISTIADDEFQLHFHKGNGRLPPNIESSIIGRIYKLVAEFTAGNVSFPVPNILLQGSTSDIL